MIKGFIFDVDGTLLDSMGIWLNAASNRLRELGKKPEKGLDHHLATMTMKDGATYVKEKYGLEEDIETIINDTNKYAIKKYLEINHAKPYIKEFLEEAKKRNIPMVVATSSDRIIIEKMFEKLSLLKYFDKIYTCSEIGKGKTEPDIYFEASEYLGLKPEECWVFEDALHAAETVKSAGFKLAGVYDEHSESSQEKLKKISDYYFKDYSEYMKFFDEYDKRR